MATRLKRQKSKSIAGMDRLSNHGDFVRMVVEPRCFICCNVDQQKKPPVLGGHCVDCQTIARRIDQQLDSIKFDSSASQLLLQPLDDAAVHLADTTLAQVEGHADFFHR